MEVGMYDPFCSLELDYWGLLIALNSFGTTPSPILDPNLLV